MDLQHDNYVYPIELDFDLQAFNDLLTRCTKYDQEAINVSLKRDGGKFTVVEGQTGYVLDVEKSIDAVYDYLTEEWNHEACSIPLEIVVDEPKGSAEELAQVTDILASLHLEFLAKRTIRSCSTGEFRRLLLARALAGEPDLLLLDEPFSGLDAPSRNEFFTLLNQLARQGVQMILVTHHKADIFPAITHMLQLENGRISAIWEQG